MHGGVRGRGATGAPTAARLVALDVINASSGRSFVSEVLIPERVLTDAWPRTFRPALLDKDVGIRLNERQAGVRDPRVTTCRSAPPHSLSVHPPPECR
jgi:3-hydroxyisobutyrate dehydrogenase-like beta-hydroxyacid dehydrogenase